MSKETLPSPNVQSTINMNLNQNDIIEVAIQTQIELLEPQIEELEEQVRQAQNELGTIKSQFIMDAIGESQSSPAAKKFLALAKKIDPKAEIQIINGYVRETLDTIETREFQSFEGYNDPEEQKAPVTYFKRNLKKRTLKENIGKQLEFSMKCILDGAVLTSNEKSYITTSDKLYKAHKKAITAQLNKIVETAEKYNAVRRTYLELKYDDKRVKARFVKTAMSKSDEGRAILGLLEEATKFKLLS